MAIEHLWCCCKQLWHHAVFHCVLQMPALVRRPSIEFPKTNTSHSDVQKIVLL